MYQITTEVGVEKWENWGENSAHILFRQLLGLGGLYLLDVVRGPF